MTGVWRETRAYFCDFCDKAIEEPLRAADPFNPVGYIMYGCPTCRQVVDLAACDAVGCDSLPVRGWPDGLAYRNTCSRHYAKEER